jgi:small subunit ribosomal protein S9
MDYINATGRRKASIARVFVKKGSGQILINGKDLDVYFSPVHLQGVPRKPLQICEVEQEFDIKVNVSGGGVKGQAEAISLGIARALVKVNEEFKPALRAADLLTRDSRVVERKKPGLKKARKSDQFSKR